MSDDEDEPEPKKLTFDERAAELDRRRVSKGCASDIQWCRWIIQADIERDAYLARYKQLQDAVKQLYAEAQPELDTLDLLHRVASWRAKYRSEPNEEELKAMIEQGFHP